MSERMMRYGGRQTDCGGPAAAGPPSLPREASDEVVAEEWRNEDCLSPSLPHSDGFTLAPFLLPNGNAHGRSKALEGIAGERVEGGLL